MSTALYRRYRPESFADVIGQEHVTEPLMQALRTGRVNHAYLFSGPRGCGKTTSARILARCLNCEQGPTDVPCGVCDSCVALARGGSGTVDVIEIDAASHGGVDDARDLREKASFGPAASRFKVYIIDEAHMVTAAGFNALLKVVEEPPPHVKFIFATTEPDKVIGTIRSRTHHYPFRLVPPARLQAYLGELAEAEGVPVAKGVLPLVVRAGAGSVRDSLSVLDQLIAGSTDDGLTYEGAVSLLGYTDAALLDSVVDAFAAGDAATVFQVVDRVVETGHEPRRFVEDLLERLRDLVVVQAVPEGAGAILRGLPEDQLERLRQQATHFGSAALSRAADVVATGLTELTGATSPRLQLELLCARVLLPGASGEDGYGARLDRIERRLQSGVPVAAAPTSSAPAARRDTQAPGRTAPPPRPEQPEQPEQRDQPAPGQPADRPTADGPTTSARPTTAADDRGDRAPAAARHQAGAGPQTEERPQEQRGGAPAEARPEPGAPPATAPAPAAEAPAGHGVEAIRAAWPGVVERLYGMKKATWSLVKEHAQVLDFDGRRLTLGISSPGLTQTFRAGAHGEFVRQALIDELGVDAVVDAVHGDGSAARGAAATRPSGSTPERQRPPQRAAAPARSRPVDDRSPAPVEPPGWDDVPPPTDEPGDPEPGDPEPAAAAAASPAAAATAPAASVPAGSVPAGSAPAASAPAGSVPAGSGRGAPADRQDGADQPVPSGRARPGAAPSAARTSGGAADAASGRGAQAPPPLSPPTRVPTVAPADDLPSDDDVDAEDSGMVGRPVVERLLGGRVIGETGR